MREVGQQPRELGPQLWGCPHTSPMVLSETMQPWADHKYYLSAHKLWNRQINWSINSINQFEKKYLNVPQLDLNFIDFFDADIDSTVELNTCTYDFTPHYIIIVILLYLLWLLFWLDWYEVQYVFRYIS